MFLPGESQGWGSLVGCCLCGRTELDTTEATQHGPSKSFLLSDLTFMSLIHFEFIFMYGVRKCYNFILLCIDPVFPSQLIEENVFSTLYILSSFVRIRFHRCMYCMGLSLGYLFLLVYTSVSVSLQQCLGDCSFEYSLKSERLILPALSFFLKVALAIQDLLCFHTNCEIFYSSSVKNVISNLIGIVLNLQITLGSNSFSQ